MSDTTTGHAGPIYCNTLFALCAVALVLLHPRLSCRNIRALPFDSVDELMGSLEDLSLNQTRATASVRLAGGMNTRSKEYQQAFRSKQYGGIMTVTADPFEDEAEEFCRVYAVFREGWVWEK